MTVWGLPRDLLRPGSWALFPRSRVSNGTQPRLMLLMKSLKGDPTHAGESPRTPAPCFPRTVRLKDAGESTAAKERTSVKSRGGRGRVQPVRSLGCQRPHDRLARSCCQGSPEILPSQAE